MPTVIGSTKADFDKSEMEKRGQLKPQAYDPGIVNVPLSKRGDIDKQLDKYKEEQKRIKLDENRKRREESKQEKIRAKAILDKHLNTIVEKTGPKFGEAKIKSLMSDWSKHEPHKIIHFFNKFSKEHGIEE
jgi:hypothetical protein